MSLNRVQLIEGGETLSFHLFPEEKIFFTSKDFIEVEYDNSGGKSD